MELKSGTSANLHFLKGSKEFLEAICEERKSSEAVFFKICRSRFNQRSKTTSTIPQHLLLIQFFTNNCVLDKNFFKADQKVQLHLHLETRSNCPAFIVRNVFYSMKQMLSYLEKACLQPLNRGDQQTCMQFSQSASSLFDEAHANFLLSRKTASAYHHIHWGTPPHCCYFQTSQTVASCLKRVVKR